MNLREMALSPGRVDALDPPAAQAVVELQSLALTYSPPPRDGADRLAFGPASEEVHRAALPGAPEDLRNRRLQARVGVADRQLDADQAALDQASRHATRVPARIGPASNDATRRAAPRRAASGLVFWPTSVAAACALGSEKSGAEGPVS